MSLKSTYKFLRKLISKKEEKGEISSGYWPRKIREKLLEIIPKKGKILEVGCGEGLFLSSLGSTSSDLEMFGVDISEQMLQRAKERISGKNINLIKADGCNLPFEDNTFDSVVCISVLYNLDFENVTRVVKEMFRVCKSEGKIYFDIRNKRSIVFKIQYKLAKYVDPNIPVQLNPYKIEDFSKIVSVHKVHYIGFPKGKFVPVMIIESKKKREVKK